jgi:DNA-binding MarR family transcriptional regulator
MALIDVLGTEMETDAGIPMRWYDVLIHLEEAPDGLRMKDLAERILYSKSGFTNVVDRMEKEGLVKRVRPETDRRSILIVLTDAGRKKMEEARRCHRRGLEKHFSRHLADSDVKALTRAFDKLTEHARPLRPGRIRD